MPGLDLPTVSELGFPGLNFEGLVGIVAARSSGLPSAVRERIAADVRTVSADPLLADRLAATAQINSPGTPAELPPRSRTRPRSSKPRPSSSA